LLFLNRFIQDKIQVGGIKLNNFGLIGCGNMGSALWNGLAKSDDSDKKLFLFDIDSKKMENLAKLTNSKACKSLEKLFSQSELIIIALKPSIIPIAFKNIDNKTITNKLIISIAAGVSIKQIQKLFPNNRIIRVMPNTPALVSQGVSGYTPDDNCTAQDITTFKKAFSATGSLFQFPEKQMDAVTGLSGSGPAFVFMAINAMAEGGVRQGIAKPDALKMAAKTFLGAATMVLENDMHPELLKDMVTSPGGTTAEGLAVLENYKLRAALIEAVSAAADKSRELSKG